MEQPIVANTIASVAPLASVELLCRHVCADVLGVPDAVQLISDFADYSCPPFWTMPRACEQRQLQIAKRLVAREVACAVPVDPFHCMSLFNDALGFAVDAVADVDDPSDEGMALVRWLCHDYCPQGYAVLPLRRAASQGKLKVLEWLVEHHVLVIWSDVYANAAASGGHLSVLEWFLSHDVLSSEWINASLEDACSGGHEEVVEWLLAHGAAEFFASLNNAVASGHVNVAKRLVEHFGSDAMSPMIPMLVAAGGNRVDALEWLQGLLPEVMGSESIMDAAGGNGHMEALV
ncbi:hypothetical protein PybrP1_005490 [[Pythium] brassicae (nom. inval.)]|nr:hypothetical protein PybrP1_005490 [[Pythium] brassicae (nom. inval.)]